MYSSKTKFKSGTKPFNWQIKYNKICACRVQSELKICSVFCIENSQRQSCNANTSCFTNEVETKPLLFDILNHTRNNKTTTRIV